MWGATFPLAFFFLGGIIFVSNPYEGTVLILINGLTLVWSPSILWRLGNIFDPLSYIPYIPSYGKYSASQVPILMACNEMTTLTDLQTQVPRLQPKILLGLSSFM